MAEFPSLTAQQRRRLAERGIDPEWSYKMFQAEIHAGLIPDELIEAIGEIGDPDKISERELDCLQLLADGCTNKETADRLLVSEETVKSHLRRLFARWGARGKAQAVHMAHLKGLL